MSTFDDYLDALSSATDRAALQHVRELVAAEAPDAEEATSYGMPAFKLQTRPLVGVMAAKQHLSVFPFSPEVIEKLRGPLEGFALSKGTIRFTAQAPIPDEVLREVVRLRRAEILG